MKPMTLRLKHKPSEKHPAGVAAGSKLFTPDGSEVTGIVGLNIAVEAGKLVMTTVQLNSVLIEYDEEEAADKAAGAIVRKETGER